MKPRKPTRQGPEPTSGAAKETFNVSFSGHLLEHPVPTSARIIDSESRGLKAVPPQSASEIKSREGRSKMSRGHEAIVGRTLGTSLAGEPLRKERCHNSTTIDVNGTSVVKAEYSLKRCGNIRSVGKAEVKKRYRMEATPGESRVRGGAVSRYRKGLTTILRRLGDEGFINGTGSLMARVQLHYSPENLTMWTNDKKVEGSLLPLNRLVTLQSSPALPAGVAVGVRLAVLALGLSDYETAVETSRVAVRSGGSLSVFGIAKLPPRYTFSISVTANRPQRRKYAGLSNAWKFAKATPCAPSDDREQHAGDLICHLEYSGSCGQGAAGPI